MNKILLLLTISLSIVLAACTDAQVVESPKLLTHPTVVITVTLRKWETKGAGENIGTETISVVTSASMNSDIVILRWNDDRSEFSAETYKPNSSEPDGMMWDLASPKKEKQIVKQLDGRFLLTYQTEEGMIVESFRLPEN